MSRTKETTTGQVGLGKWLQTSLYGIERKATRNNKHRFENLYALLNKWNLSYAWKWINKRAFYGIRQAECKRISRMLGR